MTFLASISRGWHEIVRSMTARLSTVLYLGVSTILSIWIPLNLGIVTSFGSGLLISGTIVVGAVAAVDVYKRHRPARYIFRWTYAVQAVAYLYFTSKFSPEPELTGFVGALPFIISIWSASLFVMLFVASRDDWIPWRFGFLVLYGMTSFSFTQCIDKQPMAAAYPLICASTIWIEVFFGASRGGTGAANRGTYPLSALLFSVISANVAIVQWGHQPDFFYPTFSMLLIALACLFSLYMLRKRWVEIEVQDFVRFQVYQTVVLFCLTCHRIYTLAEKGSLWSAMTSKLWITDNHPNALGVYCASCCFLALALRPDRFNRWIRLGWISLSGIMLVLTSSRASWLSLLIVAIVGMNRKGAEGTDCSSRHRVPPGMLLTITAGMAMLIIVVAVTWYRVADLSAVRDRIDVWWLAIAGAADAPVMGHGLQTHSLAASYVSDYWSRDHAFIISWLKWDRLGRHFHNLILETAWTFGMVGLIVLVVALYEMREGMRSNQKGADSGKRYMGRALAVVLVSCLFDFTLYYPAVCMLVVVLFGFLAEPLPAMERIPIRCSWDRIKNRKRYESVVPLLGIAGLVGLVCFPALGEHWLARGDRKVAEDPVWAFSAYEKAVFYRPWHRQSVEESIRCLQNRDLVARTSSIIRAASEVRPDWLENRAIRAWIDRDAERRVDTFQSALKMDPHGLLGRFFHIDLVFSMLLLDPEKDVEDLLAESIQYDPGLVTGILRSFTLRPGEFVIRGATLRQFLTERYGKFDYQVGETQEIRVPLDSILSNLESRLMDDGIDGIDERRRRLIRARWARLEYMDALRLSRRWKILFDSSADTSDDSHRVLEAYTADSPDYKVVQGNAALAKGDFEKAEKCFFEAAAEGVESGSLFRGIGAVRMHQNKYDEALTYLIRAAEREPEITDIQSQIGICRYYLGQYRQAIDHLERSLCERPYNISILRYLGMASHLAGEFDRSETYLKFVLDVTPDVPESEGWRQLNLLSLSPRKDSVRETVCRFAEEHLRDERISRDLSARLGEISCP